MYMHIVFAALQRHCDGNDDTLTMAKLYANVRGSKITPEAPNVILFEHFYSGFFLQVRVDVYQDIIIISQKKEAQK